VGILAFEEVKGIFESDSAALEQSEKKKTISLFRVCYCGFAIRKSAYLVMVFPSWMIFMVKNHVF
jgi:hypothetical protein